MQSKFIQTCSASCCLAILISTPCASAQKKREGKKAKADEPKKIVIRFDHQGSEMRLNGRNGKSKSTFTLTIIAGQGGERIACNGSILFEGAKINVAASTQNNWNHSSAERCEISETGVQFVSSGMHGQFQGGAAPKRSVTVVLKADSGDPKVHVKYATRLHGSSTLSYAITRQGLEPEKEPAKSKDRPSNRSGKP